MVFNFFICLGILYIFIKFITLKVCMGWEYVDFKGLWFPLPVRDEELTISESMAVRPGYQFQKKNKIFMFPVQEIDIFNQEVWVCVKENEEYNLHCFNPNFLRIVEPDQNNSALIDVYNSTKVPAFYNIKNVDVIEQIDSTDEHTISDKQITNLMNEKQIIEYCDEWISILPTVDFNFFDNFNISECVEQLDPKYVGQLKQFYEIENLQKYFRFQKKI